jgi:G patch domain-containing protein 1
MSEKDRERIKRIASGLTPSSDQSISTPTPASAAATKIEPHVAQAALRGYQPFTIDPAKQARYTAYLQSHANTDEPVPDLKPLPGQKADEFTKELEDYAKAASLFKPISGAMAGRFTSAAVIDFGPKVHEGLHTPSHEEIAAKEAQRLKEEEDKISPKAHAAKMGMFGPLTRETQPWQPVSRLCKRFGVKVPDLPPNMPNEASSSKAGPSFTQSGESGSVPDSEKDLTVPVQKSDGPRDLANIGLGEDETQGQDTLTYERPSMDIFKAIFASDVEDSDDEELEPDGQPDLQPSSTNLSSLVGLVADDIPVDLSTFKPTFIPRDGKSKDKEKPKDKREKKKEKKEKKGVLVSFAIDDDGTEPAQPKQSKDRPKKKKRKDKKEGEDDKDVGMWADKPPMEVIPSVISAVPDASTTTDISSAPKGRKRAIDFM